MSFRELRNFTEMMRGLGYPRLISVDNFRSPNFELVADILYWMVRRYDPDTPMSDNIETEADRIDFLTSAVRAAMDKAHVKLNAKRLYAADGQAIKELLKLSTLLYKANRAHELLSADGGTSEASEELEQLPPISSQASNIKTARHLSTELTEKGARLYDLLGEEQEMRKQRLKALAFLEAATSGLGGSGGSAEQKHIEASLREIISRMEEDINSMSAQVEELQLDAKSLEAKVKKAEAEMQRTEKRYKSLQSHRPAFAAELEKVEGELQRYYHVYLDRFRNLGYLERELDEYNKAEQAEMDEHLRRRNRNAERVRREQLKQFIGRETQAGGGGLGENGTSRREESGARKFEGRNAVGKGRQPEVRGTLKDGGGGSTSDASSNIDSNGESSTEEEVSLNGTSNDSASLQGGDESSTGGDGSGSVSWSDDAF